MKKITIFIFLFIVLSTNFILFSRSDCRTIELFKPKYSFRKEHIKTCFSKHNFRENTKNIIRNYPYLYNLAYAMDTKTGEEIWSYQMDAAGSAPPIIFNYNGKQFVSFVSTGGRYHNYKEKGSSIYTFGIVE